MNSDKFCRNCVKQISENFKFFPNCGTKTNNKIISGKDWLVCLILLAFSGMLGIHKFYLGRTSEGVVMLVLTLTFIGAIASFVLWIIDLIQLVSGDFKDAEGKYIKIK